MDALQPGHYLKTPFCWEAGCPEPPAEPRLRFEAATDEWLRSAIGRTMEAGTDESDQYNVLRLGVAAAVQKILDLLPQHFDRPPSWWQLARNDMNEPVGFVLPVQLKEARFWKDDKPQGTIFYMGVLPEFRGRGHALELVHEATRRFVAAGCWRIVCDTGTNNTPMIRTFRQAGYIERQPWQRPLG
ncbi:MAG: GNAT family N-acetyltransferase [Candidatus Eisenbacteria bacterium]